MLSLTPFLSLVITLLLHISLHPVHVSAATPIAFINPPPLHDQDRDDRKNAVYPIGSTMRLQWTEDQTVRSSLVLYQVLEGDVFEYIAPNHIQVTDYDWIVNTAKNLSLCNVFQFALYSNGHTAVDAMSHYFNITSASSSSPNLSADSSLPVTSSEAPSLSSSSTTAIMTGTSTTGTLQTIKTSSAGGGGATTSPASTDAADANADSIGLGGKGNGNGSKKELSTPSAIGIGIGVSSAIFLAITGAFGYWMFRVRRPKRNNNIAELPPPQTQTPAGFVGSPSPGGMVMTGNNTWNAGNGNGNEGMYQTKDIFGGELQGNGPHGTNSVYEIDSEHLGSGGFAWDRARIK